MNKILIASIIALAGAVPMALPAQAATTSGVPYCSGGTDEIDANNDDLGLMLKAHGINASSAEEWNGCIRAFVTDKNGNQAQVFYDPDTLAQVGKTSAAM